MDIPRITLPPADAQARFAAYARGARQRADEEIAAIRDGYAALARGNALIDLNDVMDASGVDANGLPRLAIGRAHWRFAFCKRHSFRAGDQYVQVVTFTADRNGEGTGQHAAGAVRVPANRLVGMKHYGTHRAAVPVVPPDLLPKVRGGRMAALNTLHVLWEAEWEPVPPVDPVLLRHVGGALYEVLAEWDLTPLERAVMSRRFTA